MPGARLVRGRLERRAWRRELQCLVALLHRVGIDIHFAAHQAEFLRQAYICRLRGHSWVVVACYLRCEMRRPQPLTIGREHPNGCRPARCQLSDQPSNRDLGFENRRCDIKRSASKGNSWACWRWIGSSHHRVAHQTGRNDQKSHRSYNLRSRHCRAAMECMASRQLGSGGSLLSARHSSMIPKIASRKRGGSSSRRARAALSDLSFSCQSWPWVSHVSIRRKRLRDVAMSPTSPAATAAR